MWLIRFDKKKPKRRSYRKPKGFFDTRDVFDFDFEREWKRKKR